MYLPDSIRCDGMQGVAGVIIDMVVRWIWKSGRRVVYWGAWTTRIVGRGSLHVLG